MSVGLLSSIKNSILVFKWHDLLQFELTKIQVIRALSCLFLRLNSSHGNLEKNIQPSYCIRNILDEFYVVIMWFISQLINLKKQKKKPRLPKLAKNWFQQSRIQAVRANWLNIHIVLKTLARSNKYDIDANNLDD